MRNADQWHKHLCNASEPVACHFNLPNIVHMGESNIPVGLQNWLQNSFRYKLLSPKSSATVLNQTPVML